MCVANKASVNSEINCCIINLLYEHPKVQKLMALQVGLLYLLPRGSAIL